LSDRELAALLSHARELAPASARRRRDYVLLATLANTGIRPGEALALTVEDLHLSGDAPWIRVRRLKRRRERGVIDDLPLAPALARLLIRYVRELELAPGARLFPITVRQAERVFHHHARAASLEGRRSLYSLRHTAGTRLRRAGDLRLVQELLGHASITTTQIYAHVTPDEKREAVAGLGCVL
jgi:integrase/recombinase XerD